MNYLKSTTVFLFCFLAVQLTVLHAQTVPQSFNYQAVARDYEGFPIANEEISVEISILQGAATGTLVWQETHTKTTDDFGLFNVVIGSGTPTFVSGTVDNFSDIDWAQDAFYVKIRADFGVADFLNGMVDMGTVQLQSVPYALVADTALHVATPVFDDLITASNAGDVIVWNGTEWETGQPFLTKDGQTDLTGDWTITSNNITLTLGTLTANHLVGSDITLEFGQSQINEFSTDYWLGGLNPSNLAVPTEYTVKWYIDHKDDSIFNANPWTYDGTLNHLYNLDEQVGIRTVPEDNFHAEVGNKGFLVTGTFNGVSPVLASGAGTRMGFYPNRGAFRAGTVEGTGADYWNTVNVGNYSAALGHNNMASGENSFATGNENQAAGAQSVTFGQQNVVEGTNSMAVGNNNSLNSIAGNSAAFGQNNTIMASYSMAVGVDNEVFSDRSFAFGKNNSVPGLNSIAIGINNVNNGAYSAAIGFGNEIIAGSGGGGVGSYCLVVGNESQTEGNAATAIGYQAYAREDYSFAAGNNATAFREASVSMGTATYAEAVNSVALGRGTYSTSLAEVALGSYNTIATANSQTSWSNSDRLLVVGNGSAASSRSDAMVIWKDGKTGIGINNRGEFSGAVLLAVAGDVKANGVVLSSDRRYKKNISPLQNILQRTMQLQAVNFQWRNSEFPEQNFPQGTQLGLIAQDVETIFPDLVTTGENGYKSVNYIGLISVLLQTIQEQQLQIEQLKNDNNASEATIETLQTQYNDLNGRLQRIEALLQQSDK